MPVRSAALALLVVSTALFAGCGASLKGRWQGAELKPEMARDQFKFLVPATTTGKFVSADVNLQKDKTFSASVIYDEKVIPVTGTWAWKDRILTMRDSKGQAYVYGARKDGSKLKVITGIKGSDVTFLLEKD